MSQTRNLQGIIYRIYNSGQADKVVCIIDEEGKKNSVLAKGVKKAGSKKAYSIELGNYVQSKVVEGYSVPILTEVKVIDEFKFWKEDYQKIIFLQFFCEIIDKFCYQENKDVQLFKLFYKVLSIKSPRILFVASAFLLKILNETGNLPELNECVISNKNIDSQSVYWAPDYVGYVSDSVLHDNSLIAENISERIVKTQKFIVSNPLESALRVTLDIDEEFKMLKIALGWVENVIDSRLKSKEILFSTINVKG